MTHLTLHSDVGPLERVLLRHARAAFPSQDAADAGWAPLGFAEAPRVERAWAEYDALVARLEGAGATVEYVRDAEGLTLDSVYVRDASVVCDRGAVLCRMGKPARAGEPAAHETAYRRLGIPVLGRIEGAGRLEGGDVVWLDDRTLAVGEGYRTNAEGIAQLERLLGDAVDRIIRVPLPHWRGPADVFHLMSILSPLAPDRALVYEPLLPVPFRSELLERGFVLIAVPDEEFGTQGTNVLALGGGRCLALDGNPRTRERIERAGFEVLAYEGTEISVKGMGGPTCLTRPLSRAR